MPRRPKDPAFVGDYRVLRLLGEGGMGTVYLGEAVDGRRVAVKVIQSEYARDPDFRERFRAETAHARRVEEAYTAAVLDADPDAVLPYLVTEYVPGPTLRAAVNAGGPLSSDDLSRLAVGMAAALTAIHGAGIAHHDLKPGNVLLGPSGPRVIDFGIANGFTGPAAHNGRGRGRGRGRRHTDTGQIGTPGYMAPEQDSGIDVGPAADIFAWAAVMLFAASGAPPFGEGTPEQLMHRVAHDDPDLGSLPADLAPLVRKAFSKDPADRPSAADLLLMLMGEKTAPQAIPTPTRTTARPAPAPVPDRPRPTPAPSRTPVPPPSAARPVPVEPPASPDRPVYPFTERTMLPTADRPVLPTGGFPRQDPEPATPGGEPTPSVERPAAHTPAPEPERPAAPPVVPAPDPDAAEPDTFDPLTAELDAFPRDVLAEPAPAAPSPEPFALPEPLGLPAVPEAVAPGPVAWPPPQHVAPNAATPTAVTPGVEDAVPATVDARADLPPAAAREPAAEPATAARPAEEPGSAVESLVDPVAPVLPTDPGPAPEPSGPALAGLAAGTDPAVPPGPTDEPGPQDILAAAGFPSPASPADSDAPEPTLPVWSELVAAAGLEDILGREPSGSGPPGPRAQAASAQPAALDPVTAPPVDDQAAPESISVGAALDSGTVPSAGPGSDTNGFAVTDPLAGDDESLETALFAAASTDSAFAAAPDENDDQDISVESGWATPAPSPFDNIVWSVPASARAEDPFGDDPLAALSDDHADAFPPLFAEPLDDGPFAPDAPPPWPADAAPVVDLGPVDDDTVVDAEFIPVLDTVPALDQDDDIITVAATGPAVADASATEPPDASVEEDVDISVRYVDGAVEVVATAYPRPVPADTTPALAEDAPLGEIAEPAGTADDGAAHTPAGTVVAEITVADLAGLADPEAARDGRPGEFADAAPTEHDLLGVDPFDPLGLPEAEDDLVDPPTGAELVLAPWPEVASAVTEYLPPAAIAARAGETEIDADGVIDVGPDWIQEIGSPKTPVPPIRLAELHALWEDEVDLDPQAGVAETPAEPSRPVGAELSLASPAWPATTPTPSTDVALYSAPGAAPRTAPLEITTGATAIPPAAPAASTSSPPPGAAPVAAPATVSAPPPPRPPAGPGTGAHRLPPVSPDSLGPRARARAARRGARRRRTVTIVVVLLVALAAIGVPIVLSQSGDAAAVAVTDPSATPTAGARAAAPVTTPATATTAPTTATSATPPVGAGQQVLGATGAPGAGGPNRPGTPGVIVQAYAGGVTVTVAAPFKGGPVTSYKVTAQPGGVRTLSKPGVVQIPVNGCGQTTVTVQAMGPDGTSDGTLPQQAIGCVPPSEPTNILAVPDGKGHLVIGWDVPKNVGGNQINVQYVVTVYRTGASGAVTSESFTVVGHSYTRNAPSADDPYIRVTVAARNVAGVGPAAVAWTSH